MDLYYIRGVLNDQFEIDCCKAEDKLQIEESKGFIKWIEKPTPPAPPTELDCIADTFGKVVKHISGCNDGVVIAFADNTYISFRNTNYDELERADLHTDWLSQTAAIKLGFMTEAQWVANETLRKANEQKRNEEYERQHWEKLNAKYGQATGPSCV